MPSKTKTDPVLQSTNDKSDDLPALLGRYGSTEFTQMLMEHFHRAKRAALAAQEELDLPKRNGSQSIDDGDA